MNYLIKTHKPGMTYKGIHFFVLSRGRNTGKVLDAPCPNCWVIHCSDFHEMLRIKTIVSAMHVTKRLHRHLIGSVIEYIRLTDFRKIRHAYLVLLQDRTDFEDLIRQIDKLSLLVEQYRQMQEKLSLLISITNLKLLKGV